MNAAAIDLVTLARANLAGDDLAACLACCERAAAEPLGREAAAELGALLDELVDRDPRLERRLTALRARLRQATPAATATSSPVAQRAAAPEVDSELGRVLLGVAPAAAGPLLPLADVLGRLLRADLELGPVLDLALDLIVRSTGAERGLLVVRDAATGAMRVSRARGSSAEELAPALSATVMAELERTRRPIVTADARQDVRFSGTESIAARGVRSIACVPIPPLPGKDKIPLEELPIQGAIYLEHTAETARFGEAATRLLADLAGVIAGPIGNARRFSAERRALLQAREELRQVRQGPDPRSKFVGRSELLRKTLDLLVKVAGSEVPVRIEGESGVGKELAAKLVHEKSPRAAGPFVAESCGALAEGVIEAELFGVIKGAYTGADADRPGLFQRAHGGTLFLDEVGELPLPAQAKLLRVLEERVVRPVGGGEATPVDVRIVVATHRDLLAMVRAGEFREDLFYRLDVARVRIPPLRERREDIPLLVEHFLDEARSGEPDGLTDERLELSPTTRARLASWDWPGNVRELKNAVWRLAVSGDDGAPWLGGGEAPSVPARPGLHLVVNLNPGDPIPALRDAVLRCEREYVAAALALHGGNITRTATALGMQRPHLSRLMKRLGLRA